MQHLTVRRVSGIGALARSGFSAVLGAVLGVVVLGGLCITTGCSSDGPLRRFLTDPAERRELLLDALWYRDNEYARLRWERYANGGDRDWTRLPIFHPETAPLRTEGPPQGFRSLDLSLPDRNEEDPGEVALRSALLRIGESAFFQYPAQLVSGFDRVRVSPALARSYGLWIGATPDGETRLGGLLEVQLPSGDRALATSCATCHAASSNSVSEPGGPVIAGAANADLDIGKLASDFSREPDPKEAHWGPGRLDTSPDGVDNPAAIPELRAVAAQRYLHHDATLRNSLFALALRIETLLITSFKEGAAPPIEVPLGIALYLWQLPPGEQRPDPDASTGARESGAVIFKDRCARCHTTAEHAGEPIPLSEVQTDGALGKSPERGTGSYRVPTLRRVGLRHQLLHDGSLPDLRALLDPRRLQDGYAGGRREPGPIPGHPYGLDLPEPDRDALRTYLQGL